MTRTNRTTVITCIEQCAIYSDRFLLNTISLSYSGCVCNNRSLISLCDVSLVGFNSHSRSQ